MKAIDVSANLAGLFPFHFSDQQRAEARLALYREALAPVEGKRLETAYRRTMAGWTDRSPPLPGHILENLPPLDDTPAPEPDSRLDDDQVDAIMAALVASSRGREIVEAGLAHLLEDLVRRREVSELGQINRNLVDRLKAAAVRFEHSIRDIDPSGPFAETLSRMGERLRAKAAACNAKWLDHINQTKGAA